MLLDNGDEHVHCDGDPDLGLHRIFRGPVELLDAKMLLHPFEEKLHLPPIFVQSGNGQGRNREEVGEEHQRLARLGVVVADTAQVVGNIPGRRFSLGLWLGETDRAGQTRR